MAAPPIITPPGIPKGPGNWSVTKLQCWLVVRWAGLKASAGIEGIILPGPIQILLDTLFPTPATEGVAVELMGATIDFGLNEIPTASVQAAVGRRADSTGIVSAIHYLVSHLKMFLAASIYCQAEVTDSIGGTDEWPVDDIFGLPTPFRIFDGYIIGSTFRKTSNGVEYNLALTHWLSDLNFSSAVSRSSSPQNPSQTSYWPSMPIFPNAGALSPTVLRNNTHSSQAIILVNENTLRDDLWGNQTGILDRRTPIPPFSTTALGGLKQWFMELSLQDRLNWNLLVYGAALCGRGTLPRAEEFKKNTEAMAALMRMEPFTGRGYIDGVPLRMDATRPGISEIAKMIAHWVGVSTGSIANFTIWDKLVSEFGPELQFAIVPQVEKAIVVPFNPGLRGVWTTIFSNDYDFFDTQHSIPRPLRGVGVLVGHPFSQAGTVTNGNNAATYNVPGGFYEDNRRRNGLIVWKRAPVWLANAVSHTSYKPAGIGLGVSNTLYTGRGDLPLIPPPPDLFRTVSKSLWCDYARALYIQEVLRGRNGRLSGRLRFDIAPGSMVRIEDPEEPFVLRRVSRGVRNYLYAQVIRVSCVLNAEAQRAGTALQFSFVRTEDENSDDSFSIDRHPLWTENWYGAPLVNDPAFIPRVVPAPLPPP